MLFTLKNLKRTWQMVLQVHELAETVKERIKLDYYFPFSHHELVSI